MRIYIQNDRFIFEYEISAVILFTIIKVAALIIAYLH